ncbi:uncharacterized protein BJX67DRAFT_376751 [Aspergillus lucknowensis]|uniref:Uncharacterized protein n=1 Tax=Aspergillus lucknowensis TaxID=176173 RepID=A0ABR4M5N8_9EURO
MSTNVGGSTSRPSSSGGTAQLFEDSPGFAFGSYEEGGANSKEFMGVKMANYEMESGLRWNRMSLALNLLRNAGYEAQQPQCESHVVRSLYVNAIAYLLSGLPEDVTSEEAAIIRGSIPENVRRGVTASAPEYRPSYLHRLLASSIIYFCVIVQFLMPFIKDILYHLYRHERSLRLMERVVAFALYVAERVGMGSVRFGSAVLNIYDGKIGDTAASATSWWVEAVAGGIYEGLEGGMAILGFTGPNSNLRRPSNIKMEDDKSP